MLGAALSYGLLQFFAKVTRGADGTGILTGEVDPVIMLGACAVAMVVGLLAAALPARRAALLDPVQAIRM